MVKKSPSVPLELREFKSPEEIDSAIARLERRVREVEGIDVEAAVLQSTGAIDVATSNIRTTILEIFGPNSPENREHHYIEIWDGPSYMDMGNPSIIAGHRLGCRHVVGILNGLIKRLAEKRADLTSGATSTPSTYFDRLNLHPRILDVSRDLFLDGHPWEAVFAAAKALVNYIKEKSGRHDLDGAPLVRTVFSPKAPLLSFNALADQTDHDEQEGMMHLFEGVVLAIRNPGGHSFPEGPDQRAIEYVSFLSLLAYRVQEAQRLKTK